MNRMKMTALAVALALAGLCATWAHAVVVAYTPTAALNIDVTISGSISVQVDGAASSSYTAAGWSPNNRVLVSSARATVINNSGGLSEQWWLATDSTSINTAGNPQTWSLVASTNIADVNDSAFALQAVFITSASFSCLTKTSERWSDPSVSPPLTPVPAQYTATRFANPVYDPAYGGMSQPDSVSNNTVWAYNSAIGYGRRILCWRILGPSSTTTPDTQNVQIIVTAVQGT